MHGVITETVRSEVEASIATFESRATDPDVFKAACYLVMRDAGYTMAQIAEQWNCDRRTVYNWLDKWRQSGALKDAEDLWLLPKIEEIRAATSDFVTAWPNMLQRLKRIILQGKSDKTALEAMAWAKANIIDPEISKQTEVGAAESAYARRKSEVNPLIIQAPSFLKPKE